ncbi:hypothetical protein tb265_17940 [Gemmatimonadetes bacterium T265]|nr:hypothetical protein tb265_17940 [Gemmatimonadetes bacterium T265]
MSISGVNNPLTTGLGSIGRPLTPPAGGAAASGTAGTRAGVARPATTPAAASTSRAANPLGAAQASLPAEAPAGTDPDLWSVLTSEERTFFAKSSASGPLTYGRVAAGVQALQGNAAAANAFGAAARGGRLDVRA